MMCNAPVKKRGQTCCLDHYWNMWAWLNTYGTSLPDWMDAPLDMDENEWYTAEQERIKAYADEHEINPDSPIFKGQ